VPGLKKDYTIPSLEQGHKLFYLVGSKMPSLWSILLVSVAAAAFWTALVSAQENQYDCSFGDTVDVLGDGTLLLSHIIHPVDATLSVELSWSGSPQGYLSFGLSPTGAMVPAYAIIGLPDAQTVLKYNMVGKAVTDVTPVATQTLTNTSIEQTGTSTILRFTQPLDDGTDVVVSANTDVTYIWAYGISNDLGFHANRGSAVTTIGECVAVVAPVETAPTNTTVPTSTNATTNQEGEDETEVDTEVEDPVLDEVEDESTPVNVTTTAPVANTTETIDNSMNNSTATTSDNSTLTECLTNSQPIDLLGTGELTARQFIDMDAQTVTVSLDYVGTAWLSLGWTETGKMVPATAIIGLPDEGTVLKYDMTTYTVEGVVPAPDYQQTLSDTSIVQENGVTTLTFTKPLVEAGELAVTADSSMTIMWAWGADNVLAYHPRRDVYSMTFTECVVEKETTGGDNATSTPDDTNTTLSPTTSPTIAVSAAPTVFTTLAPTVALAENATLDCAPQTDPLDVLGDGTLLLKQFIVHPLDDTVTVELEWIGEAYLSLGFAADGKMVPHQAVIGLPTAQTVQTYQMDSKDITGVYLTDTQNLMNASIVQADGVTSLYFVQALSDIAEAEKVAAGAVTRFIWAYGTTNDLGMHANRGEYAVKLQVCVPVGSTLAPTATPPNTTAPTTAPVTATNETASTGGAAVDLGNGRIQRFYAVEKDKVQFSIITDEVAGTITVDMVYGGIGYVAFAIGTTLQMPNAIAIAAIPGAEYPLPVKFDLGPTKAMSDVTLSPAQTLMDHSYDQNATHTTMTFTKLMVEGTEPPVNLKGVTPFLYAMGGSNEWVTHTVRGSFGIDLSSLDSNVQAASSPNKKLWMVHGIFLAVAWAILVPLGVAASILRGLFTDKRGVWFKTHRNLNSLAVALTIFGFAIAVYLINDEQKGAKHFQTMKHHKTGLVVFLLSFLQALSGIFRPPAPHPPPPKDEVAPADLEMEEVKSTISEAYVDAPYDMKNDVLKNDIMKVEGPKDDHHDDHHDHSKKSTARVVFEYQHRILGLVTMVMGWITCYSGVELFHRRFGGTDLTGVLWGAVGGIAVVTLLLAAYQRTVKQ
jgi:DOMON domain